MSLATISKNKVKLSGLLKMSRICRDVWYTLNDDPKL